MRKIIEVDVKEKLAFVDITSKVAELVKKSGVKEGVCVVFSKGSTGAIIVNENDDDLISDLKELICKLVPENKSYKHPINSFSHLRAMLFGVSKTVPIINGELDLGTWQSIFLVNFDNVPRKREVVVVIR